MGTNTKNKQKVEFWFDVICPWTWVTSRWMTEVDETLNLEVTWQPFSLKELNKDSEENNFKDAHDRGHRLGMFFMEAAKQHGNETVATLYTAVGKRIHLDKRKDIDEIMKEAVEIAGIDPEIIEASDSETNDKDLIASTHRGLELVGPGVGVPIVAIDQKAFFGPVVSPAPKGEDALNLWKSVEFAINTPGFYELKRGRTGGLDFS